MRSFTTLAVAVSAFLPAILAQATVPACVLTCIGSSSALTSCQTADAQCLCSSQTFIDGVSACMIQSCSSEELEVGVGFGQQYCASVGVTVSIPTSLDNGGQETSASSSSAASATTTQVSTTTPGSSSSATADATSASSVVSSARSSASESIVASGQSV
ncbi:hypothetical protein JCM3766R1_002789 [Sporobolomyces carnicolor]